MYLFLFLFSLFRSFSFKSFFFSPSFQDPYSVFLSFLSAAFFLAILLVFFLVLSIFCNSSSCSFLSSAPLPRFPPFDSSLLSWFLLSTLCRLQAWCSNSLVLLSRYEFRIKLLFRSSRTPTDRQNLLSEVLDLACRRQRRSSEYPVESSRGRKLFRTYLLSFPTPHKITGFSRFLNDSVLPNLLRVAPTHCLANWLCRHSYSSDVDRGDEGVVAAQQRIGKVQQGEVTFPQHAVEGRNLRVIVLVMRDHVICPARGAHVTVRQDFGVLPFGVDVAGDDPRVVVSWRNEPPWAQSLLLLWLPCIC